MPNLNDISVPPSLAQYPINGDTVFVGCNLRPSGFTDKIPKSSKERDSWTSFQRDKASNDSDPLLSVQDLTTYVSGISAFLCCPY